MENRAQTWVPDPHNGADLSAGDNTTQYINPQLASPFYNGRLPPEIVGLIFEQMMSPDNVPGPKPQPSGHAEHDFCFRHDHGPCSDEPNMDELNDHTTSEVIPAETQDGSAGPNAPPQALHSRPIPAITRRHENGFDWHRPEVVNRQIFPQIRFLESCRRVYIEAIRFLARHKEAIIWQGRGPAHGESHNMFTTRMRANHNRPWIQKIHTIRVYAQLYQLVRQTFRLSAVLVNPFGLTASNTKFVEC